MAFDVTPPSEEDLLVQHARVSSGWAKASIGLPWLALGAFLLVLQNLPATVVVVAALVSILSWLSSPIAALVALVTARSVPIDFLDAYTRMRKALLMAGAGVLSWLLATWLAWEVAEHHVIHWGML